MDSDQMPKIDVSKLKQTEIDFMKLVERQNLQRVLKLKKLRRNNLITASLLGVGVVSIYCYSILAVKQETFLDDFNEPKKVE